MRATFGVVTTQQIRDHAPREVARHTGSGIAAHGVSHTRPTRCLTSGHRPIDTKVSGLRSQHRSLFTLHAAVAVGPAQLLHHLRLCCGRDPYQPPHAGDHGDNDRTGDGHGGHVGQHLFKDAFHPIGQ